MFALAQTNKLNVPLNNNGGGLTAVLVRPTRPIRMQARKRTERIMNHLGGAESKQNALAPPKPAVSWELLSETEIDVVAKFLNIWSRRQSDNWMIRYAIRHVSRELGLSMVTGACGVCGKSKYQTERGNKECSCSH